MKKNINKISLIIAVTLLLCGCGLDNYDAPTVHLTGRISYEDHTLFVRHGTISFDLYQDGFEKREPIKVYVAQDGTFSSLLYAGDYTLTATDNNGPWLNDSEPLKIELRGDTEVDYKVTPYFTISDAAIVLNGTTVKAVCNVNKVAGEQAARRLSLFIGKSALVGDNTYNYISRTNQMPVNIGGNSLSCNLKNEADYDALYARLGLQIDGVAEMIYSETVKIK